MSRATFHHSSKMGAIKNTLTLWIESATLPIMRDENLKLVETLREKIRAKEEEARQLKIVVNGFYSDAGEPIPYPNANTESVANHTSLRSDLFYGSTIAEAAQMYLEMRKASGLGSASVNDIYAALKTGGYRFDTKNEEYAKNGLRISLRKNGAVFHQLPGSGDYGLCSWYGIKGGQKEDAPSSRKKGAKRRKPSDKGRNGEHPLPAKESVPSNSAASAEVQPQPRGRGRPKKILLEKIR